MRYLRYLLVALMLVGFSPTAGFVVDAAALAPQKKTVKVKAYKKKDGTKVKAHTRKPPKKKASKSNEPKDKEKNNGDQL